jgi:predicted aspartyl protease
MMTFHGRVSNQLQAKIIIRIRGTNGVEESIETLLDTGYHGSLAIPEGLVDRLELVRRGTTRALLADGTPRVFETYFAELETGGDWRRVAVTIIGPESLMGMTLVTGCTIRIEAFPGGGVVVSDTGI